MSDIAMADEDGYMLIQRVRAREAERGGTIPAVALTGYVCPEDRARVLAAGFQAHVGKPVEPDEIVATIAALAARASRGSKKWQPIAATSVRGRAVIAREQKASSAILLDLRMRGAFGLRAGGRVSRSSPREQNPSSNGWIRRSGA